MIKLKESISLLFAKTSNLSEDRQRSQVVLRNSALSLVIRFCILALGIVTLPLVYNYLDKYQYGVYVTLTSIITWIDMFDFGIANGMRNRLTEAITDNDKDRGRRYISTSYCLLFLISLAIFVIYCLFVNRINWQAILNARDLDKEMLNSMAFWVLTLFLVRFAASIIRNVFYSFQKAYLVDAVQMIGKLLYLIVVIILIKTNSVTLFRVAVYQNLISAIIPIITAFIFFAFVKRDYAPSIHSIDFSITKDILGLGWQFFVIQLCLLVINAGNNLLISQFVNPSSVPAYSFSYQLFSYVLLVFTIIITPLWSAYTEAWRSGRIEWIKSTISKMKQIYLLFVIGSIITVIISPWIFRIWIGEKADVPILMTLAVACMMLLDMWIRIYDYLINGVGKIRVQMIVNIVMATLNIPMAYLFAVVLNFGAIGVVMASIISYGISAIISPIQAKKIINGTAQGIWNK